MAFFKKQKELVQEQEKETQAAQEQQDTSVGTAADVEALPQTLEGLMKKEDA